MKKLLFLLLFLFPIVIFSQNPKIYKVDFLLGKAQVKKANEKNYRDLARNMEVTEKDTIRTGSNSMMKLIDSDGNKVLLNANTTLELSIFNNTKSNFAFLSGSAEFKVIKNQSFSIRTPSLVVGVRGTLFSISFDPNGKEKVVVSEGKIEISTPFYPDKKPLEIAAGKKLEWNPNEDAFDERLISNASEKELEFHLAEEISKANIEQPIKQVDPKELSQAKEEIKKEEEKKTNLEEKKQTLVQKKEETKSQEPRWFQISFSAGGVRKDDYYYHALAFTPEFLLGEWIRFGLYVSLYYDGKTSLYKRGQWGNKEEWDFKNSKDMIHDFLMKFRYIKLKEKGDLFYLHLGNIKEVTLGSGFMVNRFSVSPLFPVTRVIGGEGGFDMGISGIYAFTNNIYNPEIMGGRFLFRPLFGLPFLGRFEVGFNVVIDKNPLGNKNNPTFFNIGLDAIFPASESKFFSMVFFVDVAKQGLFYQDWNSRPAVWGDGLDINHFHLNDNYGAGAGIRGNVMSYFKYEFRYYYLHTNFVANFFDSFYMVFRKSKTERVINAIGGDNHAFFISVGSDIKILEAQFGVYYEIKKPSPEQYTTISFKTRKDAFFNIWCSIEYQKKDIDEILSNLKNYNKNAALDLKIGYRILDTTDLVLRKIFSYNQKGEQESYILLETNFVF